jgi:glycine betaine/proline transport system permease protein
VASPAIDSRPTALASDIARILDRVKTMPLAAWFGILAAGVLVLQLLFAGSESFPARWAAAFADPFDRFARWALENRRSGEPHPVFTYLFDPVADAVGWGLDSVESTLLWFPWFVLPIAAFAYVARTRRWGDATVAAAALIYPGLVGLWDVTVETLALMAIAVFISVIIGIPLGVAAAFRPRFDTAIRPVMDAMQTVPAPVYFVPMLMFFGIGTVPATLATVIYALPPLVRLTTVGIRQVPAASVDASDMFGASPMQTLRKVQLPMAMPTILTGVTQTIMMALGIVVLATLLGAGGLGQEVMDTLAQRRMGRGVATGLAIVSIALVLDRLGRAAAVTDRSVLPSRRTIWWVVAAVATLTVVGRAAGVDTFPEVWDTKVFDPIDDGVDWIQENFRWLTRGINDGLVSWMYVPVKDLLIDTVAWPALVFAGSWISWRVAGWRLALFTAAAVSFIGLIGMWELSLDTLTQVIAAVVVSLLVAIPLGVWAGRSRRVEAALSPVLDALQTIPSLVYIIPAVTLFTVGVVPGIIASVLYAMVPGVRITALGIKQVPTESIEASQTFGATPTQTLLGVRLPLAATTIMAAVNQVIMMVLAMVIISGLVGGGGLGFETISAVKNSEVGHGFAVGLAIVIMAIILDRSTQAIARRLQPPAA